MICPKKFKLSFYYQIKNARNIKNKIREYGRSKTNTLQYFACFIHLLTLFQPVFLLIFYHLDPYLYLVSFTYYLTLEILSGIIILILS